MLTARVIEISGQMGRYWSSGTRPRFERQLVRVRTRITVPQRGPDVEPSEHSQVGGRPSGLTPGQCTAEARTNRFVRASVRAARASAHSYVSPVFARSTSEAGGVKRSP